MKTNRRKFGPAAALAALTLTTGCGALGLCPQHAIDAEAVGPLFERVAEVHDAYVIEDDSIDDLERGVLLGNTDALRAVLVAASEED